MLDDEIKAARDALAKNDFVLARHHLNNARAAGFRPTQADPLFHMLDDQEKLSLHLHTRRAIYGFVVAALLYGALSFVNPASVSPGILFALRLLVVPAICGIFAGHSVFSEDGRPTRTHRFARGFTVAGLAMFINAVVTMGSIHERIQSDDSSLAFFVIAAVAITFGLVAGLMGGLFATLGSAS